MILNLNSAQQKFSNPFIFKLSSQIVISALLYTSTLKQCLLGAVLTILPYLKKKEKVLGLRALVNYDVN